MTGTVTHHRYNRLPTIAKKPVPPDPMASDRRDEAYCTWLTDYKTGAWKHRPQPRPPAPPPTPAATGPGSPPPPDLFTRFPSLRVLDGILHIEHWEDPAVQANVEDLARYPAGTLRKLRSAGLAGVYVANVAAGEMPPARSLAQDHPRGWVEGKTWENAAGMYLPEKRLLLIGKGEEGSAGLAIHETGHALGALLKLDNDPQLKAHHDRLFAATVPHPCYPDRQLPKLDDYLRQLDAQGDPAPGRQEFLAESLAVYLAYGRREAVHRFDEPYVAFLETKILGLRPAAAPAPRPAAARRTVPA